METTSNFDNQNSTQESNPLKKWVVLLGILAGVFLATTLYFGFFAKPVLNQAYTKVENSNIELQAELDSLLSKARLGIYALKKGEYVPFMVKGKEEVSDEEIKAFEDLMCALFKELFDPSIPFSPVEKTSAACKYCKVKDICEKGDKTTVEDDEES